MNRRDFLQSGAALGAITAVGNREDNRELVAATYHERAYWVSILNRIASPVLEALSARQLKQRMPVEAPREQKSDPRSKYAHLEAFGRLLSGIAPWLETGAGPAEEEALRRRYQELARESMTAATDPSSPDWMNFDQGGQPVVDAAFLALAILRAPQQLWQKLDAKTQRNTIAALQRTRRIKPGYSNWLLFSAMIEAVLCRVGEWWDPMRVDYALRSLDNWYEGDGVYGDGPGLHCDYYNSYVMHPMLLAVLEAVGESSQEWERYNVPALRRATRYAALLERSIAPDGSFPAIGRSLAYRFGALHLLADMSLREKLPADVSPAQVRSALTAVMRRMSEAPGTFDRQGWMTIGFCGHQPEIAEVYISTGSCYLCANALLPLGLREENSFWTEPSAAWTAVKIWNGHAVQPDHALDERR